MSEFCVESMSHRKVNGQFGLNNKFAKVSYEHKLIRDALKTSMFKAAAGLNVTEEDAKVYYERPEATYLEIIFWEAIKEQRWDIIWKILDRILGV